MATRRPDINDYISAVAVVTAIVLLIYLGNAGP